MPRTSRALPRWFPLLVAGALTPAVIAADRPDVIVADFEGDDFRPWTAEGAAFGPGPARGALPGQMAVEGFAGRGLASSFHGGDDARGVLTSPPFRIERPYLNFLIGGGKYPGETALQLRVDGATVREATGPNDSPGGTERLAWASWDVADLVGKDAVLRVVDSRKGGWGHISVDQVVQADRPRGDVATTREIAATGRYLLLPVARDAPLRRVKVSVDGAIAREFDIKLAEGPGDFATFLDLGLFRGKTLRVEARLPIGSHSLEAIGQGDEVPGGAGLYLEADRPQFHFTSRRGWLNDPNGLVWLDGEYHLFYQHNPYGWDWGNMHWGHAVSRDLVRWTELPIALYPHAYGDWAFSGSAVVDRENTSGFGPAGSSPLVAAYTSTGRGECIVSSLDRGRTWAEFAGNPVVKHLGRDPRLLWHAPTRRWVMAVYDEEGGVRSIMFHSSADLKTWTYESKIEGFFECPDLFRLADEGEPGGGLWVLYGADGQYMLGDFDGHKFNRESGKHRTWHGNFYAAQTFSDEPKGRRVQVGWAQGIAAPGMPFNQQMTVPVELKLRPTDEGLRLFAFPVDEVATLRTRSHAWKDLKPGDDPLGAVAGDLLDVQVEAEVGASGSVGLAIPGARVSYDVARRVLTCGGVAAPMAPDRGVVRFRVLVDRGSVEVFGNGGRVAISQGRKAGEKRGPVALRSSGEGVKVRSLEAHELGSSWVAPASR